jgi:DNA-directed RNA polymerase specialized sigma24 family protein
MATNEDLTVKDISQVLDVSESTVDCRITRSKIS